MNVLFHKVLTKLQFGKEFRRTMEMLQGKSLIDPSGKKMDAKSVLKNKKYVLYYFSASWCTPCRELLPKIKKIYKENCTRKMGLEIIYVSLDDKEDDMFQYYKTKHGNWYAVPFGDKTIDELRVMYSVTHIPYLVAVKPDGTIISRSARKEIEELGINVLVTWTD